MKTTTLKTLVAATLLLTASVAFGGGDSGGGGSPIENNLVPMTDQVIIGAIRELPVMARWEMGHFMDPVNDEDISPVERAGRERFKNWKKVYYLLDHIEITVRMDQPCYHDGQPKPASAELPNKICMSLPELKTYRVPGRDAFAVKRMIKALYFHEFAHLLGASEAEAVAVQEYYSKFKMEPIYAVQLIAEKVNEIIPYTIMEYEGIVRSFKEFRTTFLSGPDMGEAGNRCFEAYSINIYDEANDVRHASGFAFTSDYAGTFEWIPFTTTACLKGPSARPDLIKIVKQGIDFFSYRIMVLKAISKESKKIKFM